jgi:hypothetical protein
MIRLLHYLVSHVVEVQGAALDVVGDGVKVHVGNVSFVTELAHHGGDFGVMSVVDSWKQVMFNLQGRR